MAPGQSPLPGQDTTQILNRIFTGRVVGQPAMGYAPVAATVVSVTSTQVMVTVDGFDPNGTAQFTCNYQPQWYWNGTLNIRATPPPGAHCLVSFPPNGIGWAIAFSGWPTQ